MEEWSIGRLEGWSDGVMEEWRVGVMEENVFPQIQKKLKK